MVKSIDRTLWLIKGKQQFIIRYQLGDEMAAWDELDRMVANPLLDFDSFDRRVLLKQLAENIPTEDQGQ